MATPIEIFKQRKAVNKAAYMNLKKINTGIKKPETIDQAYFTLKSIDSDTLSHDNLVYYNYIFGKYFSYKFRDGNCTNMDYIYSALDHFEDMVHCGRKYKVKITEKMWFVKCHSLILLGLHHSVAEKREIYLNKARKVLSNALIKYGAKSNFSYLKSKIETPIHSL